MVPGLQHLWGDGFTAEGVLAQTGVFHSLFLHHLLYFALADGLGAHLVPDVEPKGTWHGNAVLTLLLVYHRAALDVVLASETAVVQVINRVRSLKTCAHQIVVFAVEIVEVFLCLLLLHFFVFFVAFGLRARPLFGNAGLVGVEVFLLLEVLHQTLVSAAFRLHSNSFVFLLFFAHTAVFFLQLLDFFFAERAAALGEVLDDAGPLDHLAAVFVLHAVEHLLKGFALNATGAFRVAGNSSRDLLHFWRFADG